MYYFLGQLLIAFFFGKLKNKQVNIGIKKIETVIIEVAQSAEGLAKNLLISSCGLKCSYSESKSFIPKIPITTNAEVSRNVYFSINFTKACATNLIAKMPMKTPIQIKIKFLLNATAANTLSIENAISINSTNATVAQKFPIQPTVAL